MYEREESEIKIKSEIERVIYLFLFFFSLGSIRFDICQKLRGSKNESII